MQFLYNDDNVVLKIKARSTSRLARPYRLFISYAHADESLAGELLKHLRVLEIEGRIEIWHDRSLVAGERLDNKIAQALDGAEIILLLLSSDFFGSAYCSRTEMPRALQLQRSRKARIVPVVLRPVDWVASPVGAFLALPSDGRPVTTFTDRDVAFSSICKGLRQLTEDMATFRPRSVRTETSREVTLRPADRKAEFALATRMAAGSMAQRILLIEGPAGFGKSTILSAIISAVGEDKRIAAVDFKGRTSTIVDVICQLAQILETDDDKWGGAEAASVKPSIDEADNYTTKTKLLFDAIGRVPSTVILVFDTFEQATPSVRTWLELTVLRLACRCGNVRIILAGRDLPEENVEWSSHALRTQLGIVSDVDEWVEFSNERYPGVSREWIEAFCIATDGHPAQIATLLAGASRRNQRVGL